MRVVIKPFCTPGGNYFYDRETNSILAVSTDEYKSLVNIHNEEASESDILILKSFQDRGFCKETLLENIQHPYDELVEYYIENKIEKITLQVTQNCNLRCSYCAYSGKYYQRTHSNKVMPYEIMQKAVDFAVQRSTSSDSLNVGFYGGEPLLEFLNIQKLIGYISSKYTHKDITYALTTNGTVFTDQMIEFLFEKGVNVLISIDGPKELHNRNRVYPNGEGSFDVIMTNLLHIKEKYPEFYANISFNAVVAPGSDYRCVNDFFSANDILSSNTLMSVTQNMMGSNDTINYDDLYFIYHKIHRAKTLLAALGLVDKGKASKLQALEIPKLKTMYNGMGRTSQLSHTGHPGGPCIPGAKRPMVDVDGNIYACEQVSEKSVDMIIGNIFTGFDTDKVRAILNIGRLTADECKDCWNFIHCGMCVSSAVAAGKLSRAQRLSCCNQAMNVTLSNFITICLLKENGFNFREDYE